MSRCMSGTCRSCLSSILFSSGQSFAHCTEKRVASDLRFAITTVPSTTPRPGSTTASSSAARQWIPSNCNLDTEVFPSRFELSEDAPTPLAIGIATESAAADRLTGQRDSRLGSARISAISRLLVIRWCVGGKQAGPRWHSPSCRLSLPSEASGSSKSSAVATGRWCVLQITLQPQSA